MVGELDESAGEGFGEEERASPAAAVGVVMPEAPLPPPPLSPAERKTREEWSVATIAWAWKGTRMRIQRDVAKASVREAVAAQEALQRDINKLLKLRDKDAKVAQGLRERIEAEEANSRELQFTLAVKSSLVEKTKEDALAQVAVAVEVATHRERAAAATALRHEKVARFFARAAHTKATQRARLESARALMAWRIAQRTDAAVLGRALKDMEMDVQRARLEWRLVTHAADADLDDARREGHARGRAERAAEAAHELAATRAEHAEATAKVQQSHVAELALRQKQAEAYLKEMRERWRDEWGREWARRAEEKVLRAASSVAIRCMRAMAAELDDERMDLERAQSLHAHMLREQLDDELDAARAQHAQEAATWEEEKRALVASARDAGHTATAGAALLVSELALSEAETEALGDHADGLAATIDQLQGDVGALEDETRALEAEREQLLEQIAELERAPAFPRGRASSRGNRVAALPSSSSPRAAPGSGADGSASPAAGRPAARTSRPGSEGSPLGACDERRVGADASAHGAWAGGRASGSDGGASADAAGGGAVVSGSIRNRRGSGGGEGTPGARSTANGDRPASGARVMGATMRRRAATTAEKGVGTGASELASADEAQKYVEAAREAEALEAGMTGGAAVLANLLSSSDSERLVLQVSAALNVDMSALTHLREFEEQALSLIHI